MIKRLLWMIYHRVDDGRDRFRISILGGLVSYARTGGLSMSKVFWMPAYKRAGKWRKVLWHTYISPEAV